MSANNLLAIDFGTQSVRAILFDSKGNVIALERVPVKPYVSKRPGMAEQEVEIYWNSLCKATRGLFTQNNQYKNSISAVSLTTQRSTVINLDKKGQPLRPAIVWLDQRRTEDIEPMGGLWGKFFKIAGLSSTLEYFRAEAEINWIQKNQPEIFEKTDKYVFLSGYLTYRLVGKFVDSVGAQVGYIPFDYKRQKWARGYDWKWRALDIKKSKLPELVPVGKELGKITAAASTETGLPKNLRLIASAADKACEVIGSGCLKPDMGCLSFGTTATINTIRDSYLEVIPMLPAYPAALPNAYNLEIQIYRGFWMVNWFKEEFGFYEQSKAEEEGVETEELFDDLVNSVEPGSQGLILQPYWSPGLRHPGPEARGAVIGFGDVHTRAHFYRAILEGLAYALRDGAERIAGRSGIMIKELRIAGGGSQSNAAMQLTADVFGLPTLRPHTFEASGLGAAINAAVGAGIYPDYHSAIIEMVRTKDIFEPNPEVQQIYNNLYEQVYKKMYKRLKPLYKSIRKINHDIS